VKEARIVRATDDAPQGASESVGRTILTLLISAPASNSPRHVFEQLPTTRGAGWERGEGDNFRTRHGDGPRPMIDDVAAGARRAASRRVYLDLGELSPGAETRSGRGVRPTDSDPRGGGSSSVPRTLRAYSSLVHPKTTHPLKKWRGELEAEATRRRESEGSGECVSGRCGG
jgi:hypothetical protein